MKFIGDVPIGRATIQHLRSAGHDAIPMRDRLSATADDAEVVRIAAAEGRIVLCFDLDIATIVSLSGAGAPSVITFRTSRRHAAFLNARLDAVLPELEPDLRSGVLATVEDSRVRLRVLPVLRRP